MVILWVKVEMVLLLLGQLITAYLADKMEELVFLLVFLVPFLTIVILLEAVVAAEAKVKLVNTDLIR